MFYCSERYVHSVSADKYIELKEMRKGEILEIMCFYLWEVILICF